MTSGARNICGIALIGVGIIAMPLPILPGIPIILGGVAMLGKEHPLVRRLTNALPESWKRKLKDSSK